MLTTTYRRGLIYKECLNDFIRRMTSAFRATRKYPLHWLPFREGQHRRLTEERKAILLPVARLCQNAELLGRLVAQSQRPLPSRQRVANALPKADLLRVAPFRNLPVLKDLKMPVSNRPGRLPLQLLFNYLADPHGASPIQCVLNK
jgi:hypothetical protein